MKRASLPRMKPSLPYLFSFVLLASLIFTLASAQQSVHAQQLQLSLADILTGLRSKKATLPEKNQLLTDAVKKRGVTFSLTPEIEKELETTGAVKELIEVIRQKAAVINPVPVSTQPAVVKPSPSPTPSAPVPDFAFYQNRANASFVKGDYDMAVADYNKALELNSKDTSIYFNRGTAYYNKKSYNPAIADYDKALESNPKELTAYLNRADAYEKIGNIEKAINDYLIISQLEPTNEAAKNNLKRLQALQAKNLPEPKKSEVKQPATAVVEEKPQAAAPEFTELGELNKVAISLAMPIYPPMARKAGVQGKVIVSVTINEEGKVTAAKATNGNPMLRTAAEDAIWKSKFKPAMVNDKAVKATGFIVYNFVN